MLGITFHQLMEIYTRFKDNGEDMDDELVKDIFKSQIRDIADSIYDTATKETPLKLAFQKNVRDGLTPAQQFVLDGLMGDNTGAFNYSSVKTIANHKTVIFRKLGLKNEKELLHVFRNW